MDREINREQSGRLTPEERAARVKKLKRKRRTRLAIVVSAFVLMLALIVSPIVIFFVFRVNNFIVEGVSPYHEDEIVTASGIEQGKSLIFLNVDEVKAAIEKKLPYTDDVEVTKKLPDSVVIRYGETTKAFAVELSGGSYAVADSNLKVLELSSGVPEGLTVIQGASPVKFEIGEKMSFVAENKGDTETNDKTFSLILEITKAVAENEMKDINIIDVSSVNDIYFIYQERLVLRLGESSNLASKISLAQRVIADEDKIDSTQYAVINLTIAKKAYVNPSDPEDIKELVLYNGGEWDENVLPDDAQEQNPEETAVTKEYEDE